MKKNQELGKQEPVRTLTKEHIASFKAISSSKTRLKLEQEAIGDEVKALSTKLGWPAKKINSVIAMMVKEQEKGGALQESSEVVDTVEQILGINGLSADE